MGHAGRDALVLDRAGLPGSAWRTRYDQLHLNTSKWMSRLPGYPFSRNDDRWPSRDQLVAYLGRYVAHHALRLQLGTAVDRIERGDGSWVLDTTSGPMSAPVVVVATTGHARDPPFAPHQGEGCAGGA